MQITQPKHRDYTVVMATDSEMKQIFMVHMVYAKLKWSLQQKKNTLVLRKRKQQLSVFEVCVDFLSLFLFPVSQC